MALKVGELYASFNVDTSGFQSALSSIESTFTSIGTKLTEIGESLTENITKPLLELAESTWTAGSSFSQQMADVKAIAELTDEEYQMLKELALEMGSTTTFTATQAGEGLYYMAKAGWSAEEMYAGLPGILSLAAASGEDLGRVSDIVTDAMSGFGMAANEVQRFADVMAVAATASNTSVDEMGYTFQYIAPVAGALGYTIEDVAAMIALMANRGIKGSQAGVALRRLLVNMVNPGQEAFDAMNDLDLYLADGERRLYSARELLENMRSAFAVEEGKGINIFLPYDMEPLDPEEHEAEIAAYDAYIRETGEYFNQVLDVPEEIVNALTSSTLDDYERACKEHIKELEKAGLITSELARYYEDYLAAVGLRYQQQGALAGELDEYGRLQYSALIAGTYALPGTLAMVTAPEEEVDALYDALYNAEGAAEKMAATRLDSATGDVTLLQSAVEGLQITLFDLVEEDIRSVIQAVTELVQGFQSLDSETQTTVLRVTAVAAAIGPVTDVVGELTTGITKLVPALGTMAGPVGLILTTLALLTTAAVDADNDIGEGFESIATTVADSLSTVDIESAFQAISERLPALSASISSGIETLFPALATFVPDAVSTISGGIVDNAEAIYGLGLDILEGVVGGIANALPQLADSAGDIISSLIQYVLTPENWARIMDLGWAIVKGVAQGIYYLGEAVLVDAWKIFDQTAEVAAEEAEINLGEELFTADANSVLRNGIQTVEDFYTIVDAWENASSQIDKASYPEFAAFDNLDALRLLKNIFDPDASVLERHQAWTGLQLDEDLLEVIRPAFGNLEALAEEAVTTAHILAESEEVINEVSIAEGIADTAEEVSEALTEMTETERAVAQTLPEITARLGIDAMEGTASGIENSTPVVQTAMDTLSEEVVATAMANMSYESGYSIGWEYTRGISESIASGAVSVLHSAESILNYHVGRNIGVLFAEGIARGIRSGVASITSAAEYVAQQAVDASKGELDIHSPSRVAEKQIGWMYDEGLAMGLISHIGTVTEAARQVSNSLNDSFYVSDPGRGTIGTTRSTVRDVVRETNAQGINGRVDANSGAIDYDRLANSLRNHPTVMEMDGRVVARLQTKETAMAANARTKAIDLGYGRR